MSHYDIHVGDVIKYPKMVMARTVGCMALSGPARIITTYFNKIAHMTVPLVYHLITLFSMLEFYFAFFLPMTIIPTFYEK